MSDATELRPSPATYFQMIVRHFGDTEETRAAILEGTGVSSGDIDNTPTEINFLQLLRQYDNMSRLFGEGWQLIAPEMWRPAAHGAFGVAMVSAPDVGTAVEILAKYMPAHAPNQRLTLARSSEGVVLRHSLPAPLAERHWRPIVESVFLGVASTLHAILGQDQAGLRFDFIWSEPAYGERLREALCGQIKWRAPANAIVVPKALFGIRSPLADADLCHMALARLEQAAAVTAGAEGVRARVERLLARSDIGRLASSEAARQLGLSQRTLARRLADAGVSYRTLVDSELRARARRWLDQGVMSRSEIGERLGFADATGFSRACRRWFKVN